MPGPRTFLVLAAISGSLGAWPATASARLRAGVQADREFQLKRSAWAVHAYPDRVRVLGEFLAAQLGGFLGDKVRLIAEPLKRQVTCVQASGRKLRFVFDDHGVVVSCRTGSVVRTPRRDAVWTLLAQGLFDLALKSPGETVTLLGTASGVRGWWLTYADRDVTYMREAGLDANRIAPRLRRRPQGH